MSRASPGGGLSRVPHLAAGFLVLLGLVVLSIAAPSLLASNAPHGPVPLARSDAAPYTATQTAPLIPLSAPVRSGFEPYFHGCPPGCHVYFNESGLPGGTLWSVTFASNTTGGTTSSISFAVGNGSYPYTIGSVSGYSASPSSGSVSVVGSDVTVAITFSSNSSASAQVLGLPAWEGYALIIGVVAAVVAVTAFVLYRR